MNDYQEQILDHYHNPRNFGKPSWTATHTKMLQNLSCGDEVQIYLLVEDNIVKDAAFEGEGCSISIAAASLFTEEIKGKSLDYLSHYSTDDILKLLGISLTTSRLRCATLVLEASKEAISQ